MNTFIREILQEALHKAVNKETTTSSLLTFAKRIALHTRDYYNLWWISLEFACCNKADFHRVSAVMIPHFQCESFKQIADKFRDIWIDERQIEQIYNNGRIYSSSDSIYSGGIYEIESEIDSLEKMANSLTNTTGMHKLDVYYVEQSNAKQRQIIGLQHKQLSVISTRIRRRVTDYLIETEQRLSRGETMSDYYAKNRSYVIGTLSTRNETIVEYFDALDSHINSGTQTDLNEALFDMRRILQSFADIVCPSSDSKVMGADGKERTLSRDKYINRITHALYQIAGEHTNTKLLKANIEDLSKRISAVNEMTCKGVHNDVSIDETQTCCAQMFILLGDLSRILIDKN